MAMSYDTSLGNHYSSGHGHLFTGHYAQYSENYSSLVSNSHKGLLQKSYLAQQSLLTTSPFNQKFHSKRRVGGSGWAESVDRLNTPDFYAPKLLPPDQYMEDHRLSNAPDPENQYDFVLLPGTKNARPGMKVVNAAPSAVVTEIISVVAITNTAPVNTSSPCRYGSACFRKNCRFRHDELPLSGERSPVDFGSKPTSPHSLPLSSPRTPSPSVPLSME